VHATQGTIEAAPRNEEHTDMTYAAKSIALQFQ